MERTNRIEVDLRRQYKNTTAPKVVKNSIRRRLAEVEILSLPPQVVPDVQVVYVYPN